VRQLVIKSVQLLTVQLLRLSKVFSLQHKSNSVQFVLSGWAAIASVGIATHYGLDGPGIVSRWGRDFPQTFRL